MIVIIIMGVCGCGKTTVGQALANEMSWNFTDADDYHPSSNKAKMSQSIPLTDEDRWPWLLLLHEHIQSWHRRGEHAVLACSALKQMYRDALTNGAVGRQHKDVRDVATASTAEDDGSSTAEERLGDTTKPANPFSEPSRFSDVVFVYLRGSKDLLLSRLSQRCGHYMPAALLDSQLATLEEPPTDGRDLVVDIDDASSVQTILMKIKTHFKI